MPVNSRVKGAAFELVVAKAFAAWTTDSVRRTPMSGGWSKDKAHGVAGDLIFSRVKTLHVECKKAKTFRLEDLFVARDQVRLPSWWAQTRRECPAGREPLLVFCRNNFPPLVMYRRDVLAGKSRIIARRKKQKLGPRFGIWTKSLGETVIVQLLSDFTRVFVLIKET